MQFLWTLRGALGHRVCIWFCGSVWVEISRAWTTWVAAGDPSVLFERSCWWNVRVQKCETQTTPVYWICENFHCRKTCTITDDVSTISHTFVDFHSRSTVKRQIKFRGLNAFKWFQHICFCLRLLIICGIIQNVNNCYRSLHMTVSISSRDYCISFPDRRI